MHSYKLNPFGTFVESHLMPGATLYAIFHRLTGELVEPHPVIRDLLQALKAGTPVSLNSAQVARMGDIAQQIVSLLDKELLVQPGHDPLASFVDHLVTRPLQNPALTYKAETGEVRLVSISMSERIYSPEPGKLPEVIEEQLPALATRVFLAADGTKTLREIYGTFGRDSQSLLGDQEFRDTIEFLTRPERQLIKLAPGREVLTLPFHPANLVPRNFYHASKWPGYDNADAISDFHLKGISDPAWEFDVIEPTVNHALRFPNEILGGLDYGSRFCDAVLEAGNLAARTHIEMLEVGGGTGSFARSFIERARTMSLSIAYRIVDLSPALADSQRRLLRDIKPEVTYTAQDATRLDLPGQKFDLIVANEVVADFPVALVERSNNGETPGFDGAGALDLKRYELSVESAPQRFYVNAGVFRFLERAWRHLNPGGSLILTEYGSETHYPAESFHLNHSEFTIHFGHVRECARRLGFEWRLQSLGDFLGINEDVRVLNGREEHLYCLNHVLTKRGVTLPFALVSASDFKRDFGDLAASLRLEPVQFLPLNNGFHYGPNLRDFLTLILRKPIE
jgi:hypothetical protein